MDSETVFLKREELYKMVWSEPVSTVAHGYGLSDRGLGKICKRLEIPVPGRGYWQMKRKGLLIPVPPLTTSKEIQCYRHIYIQNFEAPDRWRTGPRNMRFDHG